MRHAETAIGAAVFLLAGCNFLPSAFQPPKPAAAPELEEGQALKRIRVMDVTIAVKVGSQDGGGRQVQFNGGNGALQNDITNLVIGLYDNGSVAAANASLGYIYTGAVGAANPAAAALTGANAPYLDPATHGIKNKLGSGGALGFAISADNGNYRRYLVRDYGDGSTFVSNSTTVKFKNIPTATGSGVHKYVMFAAAYDAAQTNLGYAEGAVNDNLTQGSSDTAANQLTLNLNTGVFTNNLSETPVLVPYVPSAN